MLKASEIMKADPFCLKYTDDLKYAAAALRQQDIEGAPVIDEEGRLIGLFTRKHVLDAVIKGLPNTVAVGELMKRDLTTVRPDEEIEGIISPCQDCLPVVAGNDRVAGIIATAHLLEAVTRELQEARSLNEKLDAIIDSVYEGLYITDGKGYTIRINKSYTRITGITPEEVIGWHMQDLVDKGYYSQSVTLIVLEKKQPVTIIHTIKGTKRCMITGNPIFNEKGEIVCVVTTVRDVTELNLLREKLEKTKELTRRYHLELEHLQKQLGKSEIVGQSKEILRVQELAYQAAQVDATVLLLGETGVGKDLFALSIHKQSLRKEGPFIKVNCAAIPDTLLESELFGYEKGAFTGAQVKGKPGLFELADSGTILLDEVGDLPLSLQAKLLRVIQEKEITRIGGTHSLKLDLRIIAATNHDLLQLVRKGRFREDLYYRLNVIPILIPPLRERQEDISLLVKHYLDLFNKKYNRCKELSFTALEVLSDYHWPGNVRELKNLLERIVVIINDDLITPDHLRSITQKPGIEKSPLDNGQGIKLIEAVAKVEKELINRVLQNEKSTRKAANVLGVSQPTIVRKIKKYGLKHNLMQE